MFKVSTRRYRQLTFSVVLVFALSLVIVAMTKLDSSPARAGHPKKSKDSSRSAACTENSQLSTDMVWHFGGKLQHGWQIYVPLIDQELKTHSSVGTVEFADSVAKWQASNGLSSTGVLDEPTWMAMIHDFQAARMKNKAYATQENLTTVGAVEFFDPERPSELRQVDRKAYAAYERMLAAAVKDKALDISTNKDGSLSDSEKYLKIISAFRPREYQDQLRAKSPNSGRAGLAVNSPHFTGRALDLYVGGDPVSTKDDNRQLQTNTPVYKWLVTNASKFGFRPYFYEPWHWEYVQ